MSTQPRESLRRKSAARMAAVQALYSYGITEGPKPSAERLITQLTQQWSMSAGVDDEWPMDDKPEQTMLRDVVSGAVDHIISIDETLAAVIKDNWKTERMDPVMLAILRCAVYELAHKAERKTAVIVDEYITIASGYFEGSELGFINSALQQIIPTVRS